jgi:REP element-mobilizing transposase RayT
MRQPRLKPLGIDMFYHLYNRVAGEPHELPFGDVEKEQFLRLLHRLSQLYVVDILAFTVMSNHFHLVLFAPAEPPSEEETCRRYAAYYGGRRRLQPGTRACRRMAARLRDISWFMHDLEQPFSSWFNRTRPGRRRGALWAGRFKHTLLEEGVAVWDCWQYIELNAVRAGLVADPAAYRFCSFGAWSGRGRHPFQAAVQARLMPRLQGLLGVRNQKELYQALRRNFALLQALRQAPAAGEQALAKAAQPLAFSTLATRRMRYWTDGLVIGSKRFVTQIMTAARGAEHLSKRRFSVAAEETLAGIRLVCYKRLRAGGP